MPALVVHRRIALHVAALLAPRSYEGPPSVPSVGQPEIEIVRRPSSRDFDAEIAARVRELRRLPAPPSADHEHEPQGGRGPMIWGTVFASAGAIAGIVSIVAAVRSAGADDIGSAYTSGAVTTTLLLPTPFFFGVAARRRAVVRVHRDVLHRGRTAPIPKRAMAVPGIVLASLGGVSLGASYAFWDLAGVALRAGGAGLAIGGAIWAGRVLGRRQALRRQHAWVVPLVGPASGFAVAGRF